MTDFEDELASTLQDHADGDVHADLLFTTVHQQGKRYQRRRRAVGAGMGAALTVAAVVAASAVVPSLLSHPRPAAAPAQAGGQPSVSPSASGAIVRPSAPGPLTTPGAGVPVPLLPRLPRPPVAPHTTSASTDPHVVGGNAGLLHFDVDPAAAPSSLVSAQWMSMAGLERLTLQLGKSSDPTWGGLAQVELSRDRANLEPVPTGNAKTVKIGGVTATASSDSQAAYIRWQPLPGVWASLKSPGDQAAAVRFARGVSFTHVLRCSVPFRLGWVPAGSKLDTCSVLFESGGDSGSATVALPATSAGSSYVTVEVDRPGTPVAAGGQTIGGRPSKSREYPGDGGHQIFQVDVDFGDHVVDLLAEGHYSKTTVTRIAAGYQDFPGTDPAAWPPSPLS